jgi:hypothetical protein
MRNPSIDGSGHASRGTDVPALPAALLVSSLGYTGATSTTSTSAVTIGKGRTSGTSGQPSFDDHAGEAGLPATDR